MSDKPRTYWKFKDGNAQVNIAPTKTGVTVAAERLAKSGSLADILALDEAVVAYGRSCADAAIDAACARMKEAHKQNDGLMTLDEAAAEVAKLKTEPPR